MFGVREEMTELQTSRDNFDNNAHKGRSPEFDSKGQAPNFDVNALLLQGMKSERDQLLSASDGRTQAQRVSDELELFAQLPSAAAKESLNHFRNERSSILTQSAIGLATGSAIACAIKNPALLGEAVSNGIINIAEKTAPFFVAIAAADWGYRLGAPMVSAWVNPDGKESAKEQLAKNVGSGLVDYSTAIASGIAGAGLAWRITPSWVNKAPVYDLHPSLSLGEKPRSFEGDAALLKTTKETSVADDVAKLYEKSFPVEERQPLPEVAELVEKGRIVVHTTRSANGELQAFSFTSLHDETAMKFANLDFIATEESSRSKGLGSIHFNNLRQTINREYPQLAALTLEMEHPAEKGVDPAVKALREYRSKFYDRLDTPDTKVNYTILDFEDPSYRGPAQWRAWVYKPEKFNAVEAARTMYLDEGGYGLPKAATPIKEFERANNYWEAPFSDKESGVMGGILATNVNTHLVQKIVDRRN